MVTVVDAAAFLRDVASVDRLQDRGESAGDGDERALAELLVEQVEFANTIILNKADLVSEKDLRRLTEVIATFNPSAVITSTIEGKIPLFDVIETGRFNFEQAQQAAGWNQALLGEHIPESDEFGIGSFVWRRHRPMHSHRWHELIIGDLPGVIRAKGFFWLASRMEWVGSWQLAGAIGRYSAAGFWFAAVDQRRWPQDPEWLAKIRQNWVEPHGDRRQEIVFIGVDMDEAGLRHRLDACLLTDAEIKLGPKRWSRLPDPFPVWGKGG